MRGQQRLCGAGALAREVLGLDFEFRINPQPAIVLWHSHQPSLYRILPHVLALLLQAFI